MTNTTHDIGTVDDGFHEIHLSGKQLVFLFMATTVVSVVIFLLGVMVGRGVPVQRQTSDALTDPTVVAAAAPAPLAPSQSTPPPPVADAEPAASEPPPPAPETDELSYKKRLEGEASTADRLKPRAASTPAPARAAKPAPRAPEPTATAGTALVGTPQAGTWVVQVHALRDRTVANGIVQRLIAKNYPAFLVASGPPTGTYKVHVGRFKDREQAARVVERLKNEEQFNSWITQ